MTELETAVLNWYRTRLAFIHGMTILDPTTKMVRMEDPNLFVAVGMAEKALAEIAAKLEPRVGDHPTSPV